MQLQMQLQGIDNVLSTLKKLPPDVVSKRGGVARQALAAGARIIRNEARKNLQRVTSTAGKTGVSYGYGLTAKNVIYKRKNPEKGMKAERMIISVNYKNYPIGGNKYKNRPIKFNDIAFMLEYGTSNQQAEPWLRPAAAAKKEEAINKITSDLINRVDKLAQKYLKG